MADQALTTAGRIEVVQSIIQDTQIALEAITAGEAVRIDTTTGKFTGANGSSAGEARVYGIATQAAAAGMPVTAIRKGVLAGFALTGAYDSALYLSDTDGALGTTAGTTSVVVGRVIAGNAQVLGSAADKLLFVDL